MSTLKTNITAYRLSQLSKNNEIIFHINDLSNLWGIQNPNTLRVTLKRYTEARLIHRIYRGFYSLLPIDKIDPFLLGAKALHAFCHVSTESILFEEGYINQKPYLFTFISEKSAKFQINDYFFRSRQLKDKFLYQDIGIYIKNGVRKAILKRAIADILYFNPKYNFDKKVNWKEIKKIQKEIGYPITKRT